MRPTDLDERRRVRVQYVPRGFGLALTISDDTKADDPSAERQAAANDVRIDDADLDLTDIETNDGYLTVIASGVTTLEFRRPDGGSSLLIWDESEVAWDSLRAG
ncbi:MAG: hypothetical protein OEZ14_06645 [Acidimicrobiia bacterium]|nr:hypothetical protein [Acidimicrobiia bacterium]MDH5520193.1 hypothetical protein [Acidimicrobiia bacterium]